MSAGKTMEPSKKIISYPDLEKQKPLNVNKDRALKGQDRLLEDEQKGNQTGSSNQRNSVDKRKEAIIQEILQELICQPFDPEKCKEKATVLKQLLDNKYKVEFPRVDGSLKKEDDKSQRISDKEILARNGLDMGQSYEELMQLLKVYEKLEQGLEQAEEFFRSIGIEWSSEHQMFKVKPKKLTTATTMIAFGPNYDDVIVCKDDKESGETQACVLSKENNDCPQDVTAVNLNVYKDGFQAGDDEFYVYSTESIKDFFQKNIGSYIIMKPNDQMPQMILIKVIDERERSYDEVQKERAQGKQQKKTTKKSKNKVIGRTVNSDEMSAAAEEESMKPKYYGPVNIKSITNAESIELYERHKIIKRIEDISIDDGTVPSSWYWKNQRNPSSSHYVVPPNITNAMFDTEGSTAFYYKHIQTLTEDVKSSKEPRPFTPKSTPIKESATSRKEEGTAITDSFSNSEWNSKIEKLPLSTLSTKQARVAQVNNLPPAQKIEPIKANQELTNIGKINIYHGPVTVINLGERSNNVFNVPEQPDDKLNVSLRRLVKNRHKRRSSSMNHPVEQETKTILSPFVQVDPSYQSFQRNKLDETAATNKNISAPFWINTSEPVNYETEYDAAYNKTAAKWPKYFAESSTSKRKSAVGGDVTDFSQFEHITLLGQKPTPEEPEPRLDQKILLDIGGNTGGLETIEGIELNKKTSDTQVTIALRDNLNGKKYLVNMYPEEQLKKIWSVLKLNDIDIQNVTPELVLGYSERQAVKDQRPSTSVAGHEKEKITKRSIEDDNYKESLSKSRKEINQGGGSEKSDNASEGDNTPSTQSNES